MFGKKKKPEKKKIETLSEDKTHFKIHTMQDDIKKMEGGNIPENDQVTSTQLGTDNTAPKEALKNPFLSDASDSNQTIQTPKTPTPDKTKSASDNPFFSGNSTEIAATAATAATIAPKQTPTPIPTPTPTPTPDLKIPLEKTPTPLTVKQESPQKIKLPEQGKKLSSKITLEQPKINQNPATGIEAEINALTTKKTEKIDFSNVLDDQNKQEKKAGIEIFGQDAEQKKPVPEQNSSVKITEYPNQPEPQRKSSAKKVISVILTILFLTLLIGAGLYAWYWWSNKGSKDNNFKDPIGKETGEEPSVPIEGSQPSTDPSKKIYATDFPNYIEITDSESALRDLERKITEISTNMPAQDIPTPISFLVTDVSGSPLSFRSFALLTGMQFSEDVYASAGDAFELYAVEEDGAVRYGLGFDVKDKEGMRLALKEQEPQLAKILSTLFDGVPVTMEPAFKDNIYGNYPIRYTNLTENEKLSIDYTVADRVYIGTSKNSQRAILDHFAEGATIQEPASTGPPAGLDANGDIIGPQDDLTQEDIL